MPNGIKTTEFLSLQFLKCSHESKPAVLPHSLQLRNHHLLPHNWKCRLSAAQVRTSGPFLQKLHSKLMSTESSMENLRNPSDLVLSLNGDSIRKGSHLWWVYPFGWEGEEAGILLQRWERERGFKLQPWQRDTREGERERESHLQTRL